MSKDEPTPHEDFEDAMKWVVRNVDAPAIYDCLIHGKTDSTLHFTIPREGFPDSRHYCGLCLEDLLRERLKPLEVANAT